MILGEGSSVNLDRPSSSNETFLGVVKSDGTTFLEEVSGWTEGEVFELEGLIDSSIDAKEVSLRGELGDANEVVSRNGPNGESNRLSSTE